MSRKRHKGDTKEFSQMVWKEQASSLTATLLQVERIVRSHTSRASKEGRDVNAVHIKCVRQIMRTLSRII